MIKKFNLSKPEKYIDKASGQEKTYWVTVGTLTEFSKQDGSVSRIVEIPAIGLKASVFEMKPKVAVAPAIPVIQTKEYPVENNGSEEAINTEDIPW